MYTPHVTLRDLQKYNDQTHFLTNSQDIKDTLESIGMPEEDKESISAVLVIVEDGEIIAAWVTEYSEYFMLDSRWNPVSFYCPEWITRLAFIPYYWRESNEYYNL